MTQSTRIALASALTRVRLRARIAIEVIDDRGSDELLDAALGRLRSSIRDFADAQLARDVLPSEPIPGQPTIGVRRSELDETDRPMHD
jgi:hypothetical protein